MPKLVVAVVATSVVAAAFVAGVAVGKVPPPQPKFTAAEEVKWDELHGLKVATLVGDYKKGPYGALLRIPAGYTSPLRAHTGAYEAVEISGTTSHWMRGEDGTKAKKMTPGSYWTIPGKTEHVSACALGSDCVIYIWQKVKYDVLPSKDAPVAATGSAAVGAGSGSAAKATAPAIAPKAGAGSAAPVPKAGVGSAAPKPGAGTGSATTPKK